MNQLLLQAGAEAGGLMSTVSLFFPMILIVALMYFMMIRPQKKREKAIQEMRSKIEVGDEVVTAGGIIGRVVSIRDDSIVVETGSDRSKIRVARWAIQANNTAHDATAENK